MRNLKKFLALVMAMVMAFSLMVTANAAHIGTQYNDDAGVTPAFEEAVEVLTGMGVYSGDSGSFKPEASITRAEVAALIYRLVTGDVTDAQKGLYDEYPAGGFTDIPAGSWYGGYVGYCANNGLVKGRSATTFDPSGNVTGYEVLAMILRAVGYDKNGEFTGADWRVNVSTTAQQLHILDNVKTTQYGGTLYLPARRDVVADLLFQTAANVNMVNYTPAFGYQPYGNINDGSGNLTGGTANYTLGYKVFGLTSTTRIVLGNQSTGESCTVLGTASDGTVAYTHSNGTKALASYTMYDYPGTQLTTDTADPGSTNGSSDPTDAGKSKDTPVVPEGLKLDAETDLELFGHKVKFWYDATDAGAKHTYAWIDQASLAKYVTVNNNATTNGVTNVLSVAAGTTLSNNSTTDNPTLGYAAQAAGFKVNIGGTPASGGTNTNGSTAYYSEQYARINTPTSKGALPGRTRTLGAAESPINMYYLVSNSSDKSVDVVVSLNANVGRITEVNSTAKVPSLTIGINRGFSSGMKPYVANTSTTANRLGNQNTPDGEIFLSNLTKSSTKTLGATVTAWEVIGTTRTTNGTAAAASDTDIVSVQNAGAITRANYMYDLVSPIETTTGTVSTYLTTGKLVPECTVTLTDGTVLKQSGMWDSVYGDTPTIDQTWTNLGVGVTYTFYLDKAGRILGWGAPYDYEFLYATFGDYRVGDLGTGTMNYAVTGVDWDGNIVENHPVTRITLPISGTLSGVASMNCTPYAASTDVWFPGVANYPTGVTTARTLADGYNLLPITKKDLGTSQVGNQIANGFNMAFDIDAAGDMDYNASGIQFLGYNNAQTIVAAAANTYAWRISKADADRGFIRVYNNNGINPGTTTGAQNAYLMTNDTKFIVVTGSGTADLHVDIYNGLKDLVGSGSEAIITVATDATFGTFKTTGDQVWFQTDVDRFATTQTGNNASITTVILSDTNLIRYSEQSLYYNYKATTATGAVLAGTNPTLIQQYQFWHNGQSETYFIDLSQSYKKDGTTRWSAAASGVEADTFYTLTPIGETNGVTIYRAVGQADPTTLDYTQKFAPGETAAKGTVKATYRYIVVNNLSTAELTLTTATSPVTLPYDVTNAKVCDVEWLNAQATGTNTAAVGRSQVTSIEELNNAVSVKKVDGSTQVYTVDVAVTLDGATVDTIYIYSITP